MKRLLHIILLIAGIGSANTTNAQLELLHLNGQFS